MGGTSQRVPRTHLMEGDALGLAGVMPADMCGRRLARYRFAARSLPLAAPPPGPVDSRSHPFQRSPPGGRNSHGTGAIHRGIRATVGCLLAGGL